MHDTPPMPTPGCGNLRLFLACCGTQAGRASALLNEISQLQSTLYQHCTEVRRSEAVMSTSTTVSMVWLSSPPSVFCTQIEAAMTTWPDHLDVDVIREITEPIQQSIKGAKLVPCSRLASCARFSCCCLVIF